MNEEKEEKKVERLGYTFKDLATALGVTKRNIENAFARGEFKAVRVGNKWIVPRKEADKWLSV